MRNPKDIIIEVAASQKLTTYSVDDQTMLFCGLKICSHTRADLVSVVWESIKLATHELIDRIAYDEFDGEMDIIIAERLAVDTFISNMTTYQIVNSDYAGWILSWPTIEQD